MSRPEAGDGYGLPDDWQEPYDHDAWKEFRPFRPGDKPNEQPDLDGLAPASEVGSNWSWTSPHELKEGDRVRSTRNLGGGAFTTVPTGTEGKVSKIERGLLGDTTFVQFDNGTTEVVGPDDVKYQSGWY